PQAGGVDVGDRVQGDPLLLVGGVEDRRAVARSPIVALAVERRGIVNLEEEFQQFTVSDLRRIEDDLDRFGMAVVIAIGRVGDVAAGVAAPRRDDSLVAPDEVLHAPEAAAGQNRPFLAHLMSSTWSR